MDCQIVGFAIADLKEQNIWALFVHPEHDKKGIGRKLHDLMLEWYFSQNLETVWLGTAPGTRAEGFYKKMGWKPTGRHGSNEVKFEMNHSHWQQLQKNK
ncbi:GNAT family N-acetyltransferase [Flavobacterium silvisoli]|uniref:GNAT family N-acetyltransferase n=1 Tax=Flavobacterium silvisoli TaxID=2529433 RepID=UPI0021CFD7C7|nr:GNAT family N-acetyltransferase [Flavobacterium silvisoli]